VEYIQLGAKSGDKTFSMRHGGAANLEAVLDWVYVNLKRPSNIFVAGVDAGALASPVVAARMARHYPRASVVQLGDGAGAYGGDSIPTMMSIWGANDYLKHDPTYRSLDSADFTFQRLYVAASKSSPRIRFAEVNAAEDATQLAFVASLGVKASSLAKPLGANLTELRDHTSWFRSYTMPGKGHTILRSNALYTTKVDGTAFVDWLAALINGESVETVGAKLVR